MTQPLEPWSYATLAPPSGEQEELITWMEDEIRVLRGMASNPYDLNEPAGEAAEKIWRIITLLQHWKKAAERLHRMDGGGTTLRAHLDDFYQAVGLEPESAWRGS